MLRKLALKTAAAALIAGFAAAPQLLVVSGKAWADYPEKPIKVIVGFKPGGRTDTVARLMAKEINDRKLLPQPLVVVNVPGAGSTIAGRQAHDAKPDGYTLIHWHHQMLIAIAMGTFNYSPDDFESIGFTGGGSPIWAVQTSSPYKTWSDLEAKLKAKPKGLVETIGIGTIPHFVGALLADAAGFQTRKVAASSGADRSKALLGGHADIALFSAAEYIKWREAGMRALIFFGPNRVEKIKEVPTARELGYEVTWANPNWWLAPKGTPQDRIDVIANAFKKIMADPKIQTWFSDRVLDPYWTDGPQAKKESNALLVKLKAAAANIKK
ncbi:MAG: tripartite tricarboxylate transporter substrate binding protein [Hyphomicrobiaceae bacterium]